MANCRPCLQQCRDRLPPCLPHGILSRTKHQRRHRRTTPRARRSNGSPLNTPRNTLRQEGAEETAPDRDLSSSPSYHNDSPNRQRHPPCCRAIVLGIAESAALSTWNAIIADQTGLENRDASFSLSFILGNGGVAFGFLLPTFIPAIQSLTGLNSITVHQDLLVLLGLISAITPVWLF